ncbi:hypothetical protein E4U55_001422 [Claviceps digitariae]|nr:hypothetical protein E4U55_001422 [Claviceps digitariae]
MIVLRRRERWTLLIIRSRPTCHADASLLTKLVSRRRRVSSWDADVARFRQMILEKAGGLDVAVKRSVRFDTSSQGIVVTIITNTDAVPECASLLDLLKLRGTSLREKVRYGCLVFKSGRLEGAEYMC